MVRDIYKQRDIGRFRGTYRDVVDAHGVLALKLTPLQCAAHLVLPTALQRAKSAALLVEAVAEYDALRMQARGRAGCMAALGLRPAPGRQLHRQARLVAPRWGALGLTIAHCIEIHHDAHTGPYWCWLSSPTRACAAEPCTGAGLLPSSQALLHGGEALLTQGLDRRALMMVLAVRRSSPFRGPAPDVML
jgi:hypothetical protein